MKKNSISICEIRKENKIFILAALINFGEHIKEYDGKIMDLNPELLVYDINGIITFNDNIDNEQYSENEDYAENLLVSFKSLVGYCLQNKYEYDDYKKGGMSLLKKNADLKRIYTVSTIDAVLEVLNELYDKNHVEFQNDIFLVNKNKYKLFKGLFVVVLLAFIIVSIYSLLSFWYNTKVDKEMLKAYEYYLNHEYELCNSSLSLSMEKNMSQSVKKIWAISIIKCEDITSEKKASLINNVEDSNNQYLMDYWISVKNDDYEHAATLAKQLEDNELLIYSYNKELVFIQNNDELSSEDKVTKITTIKANMEEALKLNDEN